MALATATITYNLADYTGSKFDARRTRVWATTNIPEETVVDTDGNQIRLGSGAGTIDDNGTGSITVWIPGAGSNPASWQTYIHVDYANRGARERTTRIFGPYTITANADLADLVAQVPVPPSMPSALSLSAADVRYAPISGSSNYAAKSLEGTVAALTPSGKFRGVWSSGTAYAQGDQVTYSGTLYGAAAATTAGQQPGVHASWVAIPGGTDTLARHQIDTLNAVVPFVAQTPIDNRTLPSSTSAPADRRLILQKKMPSVGKIESVTVYPRFAINPFYVELWESNGTTLTRVAVSAGQSLAATTEATITLDWWTNDTTKSYYIGIRSDGSANVGYSATGAPTDPWWTNTDKTSTSLTISGMTASVPLPVYFKVATVVARPQRREPIITVGPVGCDYTTIQDAIDAAEDTATTPVTIKVFPKATPYARFSMVGWPHVPGSDNSGNRLRYLSIVAEGGPVEVRDDSGDYRTPPAEIRTKGLIKGIRFVATHNTPFSDPTEEALARRSYAVHMDFGQQDVVFEDCELTSFQAPGAGIGFHQDEWITFRRCLLRSFADSSYGGLVNYGGLFAHSGSGEGNTNQRLNLEDTKVYAANGTTAAGFGGPSGGCAIWLDFIPTTGEMSVRSVRTSAKGPSGGVAVVRDPAITVRPDSWDNSDPALDA